MKKLPGKSIRILSFIPIFNWISLIYIGVINSNTMNIICGIIYGTITFTVPTASALCWIVGIVHYTIAYKLVKRPISDFPQEHSLQSTDQTKYNATPSESVFSDITLSGESERRQPIPVNSATPFEQAQITYSTSNPQSKFFHDMSKYADKVGKLATFEPFMAYWPTYDSMNKKQLTWYFYWRTQVRNNNFLDTDLSYIFVHIYELLSGIGWQTPQDGYQQLLKLWLEYKDKFPKLNHYLNNWVFDFIQLHNLDHPKSLSDDYIQIWPSPMMDILITQHENDVPLKIPFALIDALCDYSLVNSKFYKDGHQALMQEAIPRVVALADAVQRKKTQKGILATYGPNRPKKQEYYAFCSAVCPDANKKISVSVRTYSSTPRLRSYINEVVRYGENTLRVLYNCRGRLRGVILDEETATLIETFLKKEYSSAPEKTTTKKKAFTLDFESINILREQSDAVRTALQIEDDVVPIQPNQKELLTDVPEITALYVALSNEARKLLDRLQASYWECEQDLKDKHLIFEINNLAEHYLGCALLVNENGKIITEDDYRDELDFIYQNTYNLPIENNNTSQFNMSMLTPKLKKFIETLKPEQRMVIYVLLTNDHPQNQLEQIAEKTMTMPQMLLDDINETAMLILSDIVVDTMNTEPRILDEYMPLLKQSIA